MTRTGLLGLLAIVVAGGVLAGCQGVKVPYDQRLVAVVQETSKTNPVRVTVSVDGRDAFGPTDLAPGATREIILHDPASDTARLSAADVHKISWKLHKNGPMGKVGNADLTVYSGNTPIKTVSTKYLWPMFWITGWLDVKFAQPAGGVKTGPAKTGPAKTGPAKTTSPPPPRSPYAPQSPVPPRP